MREFELRRKRVAELITQGYPRIHSYFQLMDILRAEGFVIADRITIARDVNAIGAAKVKPPDGGKHFYVMAGRSLDNAIDTAVSESQAKERLAFAGATITDLSGTVPIYVQTLDGAGPMVGQPFRHWKPYGVAAVLSGHEGIVLYVRPEEAERVRMRLHEMVMGV